MIDDYIDAEDFDGWSNHNPRGFRVTVRGETPAAWLCEFSDGSAHWLPKSRCTMRDDVVTVPPWLIQRKLIRARPDFDENDWR